MKILLLEDEEAIRSFTGLNLKRDGHEVLEAASGEEALLLAENNPDINIAILDVMLPGIDGFEVLSKLRQKDADLGIIMLTARTMETDLIKGLQEGADDYVSKPFSPGELVARVNALGRRLFAQDDTSRIRISGPFTLYSDERVLLKNGEKQELTPKEFEIIALLLENAGRALSREELLNRIWGWSYEGDYKIVDVNIRRIRQKVEDDPSSPQYIVTVWGYGYKWRKDEDQ